MVTDSAGTSTNHNFGTRNIGKDFAGRIIVCVTVGTTGTGGRSFTNLTCNGVAGTRVLNVPSGSGGEQTVSFWTFTNVTGTTAAFVGTSTANVGDGDIAVYSLQGATSATPVYANSNVGNLTTYSLDVTMPPNAVIIACAARNSWSGITITWAGVSADGGLGDARFASASNVKLIHTTVSATVSSAPGSTGGKLLACAWA
jgi:hypothetical protein